MSLFHEGRVKHRVLIRYFRKQTCCHLFIVSGLWLNPASFQPSCGWVHHLGIYFLKAFNCHLVSKTLFTHNCWAAANHHLFLINTVQSVRLVMMHLARRTVTKKCSNPELQPLHFITSFSVLLLCHFASRLLFPSVVTLVPYCYSSCRQNIWKSPCFSIFLQ